MKIRNLATLLIMVSLLAPLAHAEQGSQKSADQKLLQRIYQLRMRNDRDRQQAENEARANVRLVTQSGSRHIDSPTVTGMRQQTNIQLSRFEQNFRCLDVDVENNGGNTVVICGDNSGDIEGTNITAGQDIVTIQGGAK